MKRVLLFLLTIISLSASAQIKPNPPNYTTDLRYGGNGSRGIFKEAIFIRTGCGVPIGINSSDVKLGSIYIDSCFSYLYIYNPRTAIWDTVGSGSGSGDVAAIWGTITGTISAQADLMAAFNAKTDKATTITINGVTYDLSTSRIYNVGTLVGNDTVNLRIDVNYAYAQSVANAIAIQQRIDSLRLVGNVIQGRKGGVFIPQITIPTQLNYVGQPPILIIGSNVYADTAKTAGKLATFSDIVKAKQDGKDTALVLRTLINTKLNISDTAGKWVSTISKNVSGDSIISYIGATRYAILDRGGSGGGSGSGISEVIAGYGLLNTNDSTLRADSNYLSTVLARKHLRDSLLALINVRVKISDTAAMLSGYVRIQRFLDSLANHWAAIQTKGNVFKVGTPTANQVAIWTPDGIKGVDTAGLFGGGGGATADNRQKAMYFPKPTFGSNVNCGYFYFETMAFKSSTYEFWIRPQIGAEYCESDGYGGAHVFLGGLDGCAGGRCGLAGNAFQGFTNIAGLISVDKFDTGTCHHIAFVFDYDSTVNITYWRTYLDGIPTYKGQFAGYRYNPISSGSGFKYLGGSDHSGWIGTIFKTRQLNYAAYGDNPFYAKKVFDNALPGVVFAMDFTDKVNPFIDRGSHFGLKHDGRPLAGQGDIYPQENISRDSIPYLLSDSITQPTYLGSNTAAAGEKIVDHFERPDKTPAWYQKPTLDSTESDGALGKKKYFYFQHDFSAFAGVIDGKAYFYGGLLNVAYAEGNSNNQDVRIAIATSVERDIEVDARLENASNRIYARLFGTDLKLWQATTGGGFVELGYFPSCTDSDIRLVVSGTTATVYTGGILRITATVTATTSNYSGFGCNSSYSRVESFKVF